MIKIEKIVILLLSEDEYNELWQTICKGWEVSY